MRIVGATFVCGGTGEPACAIVEVIGGNTFTYSYANPATSNRVNSVSGPTAKSFTYDSAGNTTSWGTTTLGYDGRGRTNQFAGLAVHVNGLDQAVWRQPGDPGLTTSYFFDDRGTILGTYESPATGTEYAYLGELPVALLRSSDTVLDNTFRFALHHRHR